MQMYQQQLKISILNTNKNVKIAVEAQRTNITDYAAPKQLQHRGLDCLFVFFF